MSMYSHTRRPLGCSDLEEDCAPHPNSLRDGNYDCEDIYSDNMVQQKDVEVHTHSQHRCDSGLGDSVSAEYSTSFTPSLSSLRQVPEEDDSSLHRDLESKLDGLHLTECCQTTDCLSIDEGVDITSVEEQEEQQQQQQVRNPLYLAQIFTQDEDGDTLLHMAIIQKEEMYARRIISMALSQELLDVQNSQQQTGLHLAVLTQQAGLARTLLGCGAQLEVRDRWGNTALHLASRDGHLDSVHHLTVGLQKGEVIHPNYTPQTQPVPQDLGIKNYEGETCLHLAAAKGHLHILTYLIQHCNADVNVQEGKSGRTVLHQAVESNNQPVIALLLQHPALNLEALTYDSRTALCLAHDRQLSHLVQMLEAAGADMSCMHGNSNFRDPDEDMVDNAYDDFSIGGQPIHSWT